MDGRKNNYVKTHKPFNERTNTEDISNSKEFKKRNNYNNENDSLNNNNYSKDLRPFINNINKKSKYGIEEDIKRIEIGNKENILSQDLVGIIAEIEKENSNFTNNVFMKNFNNLYNNIGLFDKEKIPPFKNDTEKLFNEFHSCEFLVQKYTEKAKNMKEEE